MNDTILFGIFSHNVHELDYHLDRRRRMCRRIVRNNIDKHNVHEEEFYEFLIQWNECVDVDFEDELELIQVWMNVECKKMFDMHEEETAKEKLKTKSKVNVVKFPEN